MRGLGYAGLLLVLCGCKPVAPSGDVLSPRAVLTTTSATPDPTTPADAPAEPVDGDPFADDREPEPADASGGTLTNDDLLSGMPTLGELPPGSDTSTSTFPIPPVAPVAAPPVVAAAPPPGWPPAVPLSSFGVRLVSTVPDAQPPRAILGLADGAERVVRPGDLIPEAGVVVLAIGRDQVQIANIIADGDHARVETQVLGSMFPGATSAGTLPR